MVCPCNLIFRQPIVALLHRIVRLITRIGFSGFKPYILHMLRSYRHRKSRVALPFICICSFLFSDPAMGRENFETLAIDLILNTDLNQNRFENYWHQESGFGIQMGTPFYKGIASAGVQGIQYSSRNSMEFEQYYIYLSWVFPWRIFDRLTLLCGPDIGSSLLIFPQEDNTFLQRENEITCGIHLQMEWLFQHHLAWLAGLQYEKILTRQAVENTRFHIGISHRIKMPAFLGKLLR